MYRTTVVIELYRVRCPDCRVKTGKVAQLPSKAPFSKRFEDSVGEACEGAAARRVAQQVGLAASTVRSIDLRYLQRWAAGRRKPGLRQLGVDEIHLGKKQKFLTVASNLESGEPLWFERERKKETLDEFFQDELSARQRRGIEAARVDMWESIGRASNNGRRTVASSRTSSTSCSTPTGPWTRCGGQSFSVRVGQKQRCSLAGSAKPCICRTTVLDWAHVFFPRNSFTEQWQATPNSLCPGNAEASVV